MFAPIGVLKVASALDAVGRLDGLLDLAGKSGQAESLLLGEVVRTGARSVGFTCTTPQLPSVVSLSRFVRSLGLSSVLGGPHGTLVHSAWKREKKLGVQGRATRAWNQLLSEFDTVVAGDGEKAVVDASNGGMSVIDADSPSSPYWMSEHDLDSAPFPPRHLLDIPSYKYEIDGHRSLSLIAQLGCPFNCGFCGGRESGMLRVARFRSADSVVNEVRHLFETYRVTGFMFYDDELNISQPSLLELMDKLERLQRSLNVEFRFRGFVKAQLFNSVQAHAMYRAGFRWLLVGFESGDTRILANINKKSTLAQNTACLVAARSAGLKVKALMSVGHPGETYESLNATARWISEQRPDDFDLTVITCYPGTPYYDRATKMENGDWVYSCANGDRLYQVDVDYTTTMDYYKGVPGVGYHSYVYTDKLSPTDIVKWRDRAEEEMRAQLGLQSRSASRYDHSMGQGILSVK